MPLKKEINTTAGPIAIWKLSDPVEVLSSLVKLHSNDQIKFDSLTLERRKKEFLASRILVKELLGHNQEITYNNSGKPFLKNSAKNISISHSADFAAVLISEKKVGIDIEQTTRNIDRIATRFLHPKEREFIGHLENQQFAKVLFWAAKEAIFKCSDFQGIQFNEQILINNLNFRKSSEFSGTLIKSHKSVNYKLHYYIIENNVMVYCVEQ